MDARRRLRFLHPGRTERHAAMSATTKAIVDAVVERYGGNAHYLLQILREVQEACDWIPP